ncbi:MAG: pyridoxal-dependent decarboxylase [Acidobacteria bacterium]|nr:pyridoxal-dependent decarboxylase [Acidobacteriota bacterium]
MNHLDFSPSEFQAFVQSALELVQRRYDHLDQNVYSNLKQSQVREWFDEALPNEGMAWTDLLEQVEQKVFDRATLNIGPNMYAYVVSGGNQVSMVGDFLASAIDQNVAKWHLAPTITELEQRVIAWAGEYIGYSSRAGGMLVSGGSAANLSGLTVARNLFLEKQQVRRRGLFQLKPIIVYGSDQTHNSVDKSIQMLGIGQDNYRKIASDGKGAIDCDKLVRAIEDDLESGLMPFCIVGNAGTVNAGHLDPLDTQADIAERYGLWFHVDGAYGGLAAALPELRPLFKGLERADSVACDFHKWLYQPFEVGCTLVRDWKDLNRTYHVTADYLSRVPGAENRLDITEHHFQLSRNAKALKVWMTFKAFGAERLRDMIRKDIALRIYLETLINDASDFEYVASGPLGIVCFRYLGNGTGDSLQVDDLNRKLLAALEADGRVFITGTQWAGRQVIRACIINHRTQKQDIEHLVGVIREVGRSLLA